MQRLGDPHLATPTVHVAGTNGKGSTAALVTSVLTAAGYATGLYTSPSLHSPTERIRVGLAPVSRETFGRLVSDAWPAVEWVGRFGGYGGVSYFELLTTMAFLHFRNIGAAFQVVEVGLGGRLDATNVVRPDVCAITSISLDHTRVLGGTVSLIAREKAGIVKPGAPVVVAPQTGDAMGVIAEVASARGAELVRVEDMSWRRTALGAGGQSFDLKGAGGDYSLSLPLLGDHQLENAATAVAVIECLVEQGRDISRAAVVEGFRNVEWPGRLQAFAHDGKLVLVDGAHNPDAMRRLAGALPALLPPGRPIVVFGALGSHSVTGMADELAGLSPEVVAVRSRDPRAMDAGDVASACRERGLTVAAEFDDVGRGTRHAIEMARDGGAVLATGSLSVVAEVVEEMTGIVPETYPDMERPARKT